MWQRPTFKGKGFSESEEAKSINWLIRSASDVMSAVRSAGVNLDGYISNLYDGG